MFRPEFTFLRGTTTLQLQPSDAAAAVAQKRRERRGKAFPLKSPTIAESEARARVSQGGGDASDRRLVLGEMEVQFGDYKGQTFKWLLSNNLGYAVSLLASHVTERDGAGISSNPLHANKDCMLEYAHLFQEVSAAIADRQRTGTEEEGDWLVGFGAHSSMTYRELYESTDKDISRYRGHIRLVQAKNPGSRLRQLQKYVARRDREKKSASTSSGLPPCSNVSLQSPSAPSPSPQHEPSTQRKRRRAVIDDSSTNEDDQLMVEAAVAAEQASSLSVAAPSPPRPVSAAPCPSASEQLTSPQAQIVMLEAWKHSLPPGQQEWLSKVLFTKDQRGRLVLSQDLKLWYNPPGPHMVYNQHPSSPDAFFQCNFFLWAPYRMWDYNLKCSSCAHKLTSCGLYKTVRRVLDLDGWYYMGTEYLECSYCTRKIAAWSGSVREQLKISHQRLFPAVLGYRLSCDRKVLSQMKGRTLGNGSYNLHSYLIEHHTEGWMMRSLHYLETCKDFQVAGGQVSPPQPPPEMQPVPTRKWLLSVYARDVFARMGELQASVTSIFGSILKMYSTKKVNKKLAGADAGTALCMTSVGNEMGQVLISVLTAAEGYGLKNMADGLQDRYRQHNRDPPMIVYVDRDCCRADGRICATAALFSSWSQLQVRLDVWHFMRRLAAGVSTKSHPLYPDFMRRISAAIFEWDPEDMARLKMAKQAESSKRRNVLTIKEMARHCRRRTRGAQETERLLDQAIQAFMGATDTMNIHLLDQARMEDIWRTQRKHVPCIQDPPGVRLYTETGQLTKGGVVLPVYRCARGSTSLESFHLHLSRFIPGTSANGCHFQMYLLEGLTRWNEDRAQAAAGAENTGMKGYASQKQHTLSQLSQRLLGKTLVESSCKPLQWTGEQIGIGYLYGQTGRPLQLFPDDPDEQDGTEEAEDWSDDELEPDHPEDIMDEGFSEFTEDLVGPSETLLTPPRPQTAQPAFASTEAMEEPSADQEVAVGPDGLPGYQHVVRLARTMVDFCAKGYVSNSEVEEIIRLWQNLPEVDKGPVVYPSRYNAVQTKGRFKKAKTCAPGSVVQVVGSMKRCITSMGSRPSLWPDASRLVEAIFLELCIRHPGSRRVVGVLISQRSLILREYNVIRHTVISHPAIKSRTNIQLFTVNQATLSQWNKKRMATGENTTLRAAICPQDRPTETDILLPLPMDLQRPEPAPSTSAVFKNCSPEEVEPTAGPSQDTACAPSFSAPCTENVDVTDPLVPKSTAWSRKKLLQVQEAAAKAGRTIKARAPCANNCSHCGLRRIKETGHRVLKKPCGVRVYYCPVETKGLGPEEWLATL